MTINNDFKTLCESITNNPRYLVPKEEFKEGANAQLLEEDDRVVAEFRQRSIDLTKIVRGKIGRLEEEQQLLKEQYKQTEELLKGKERLPEDANGRLLEELQQRSTDCSKKIDLLMEERALFEAHCGKVEARLKLPDNILLWREQLLERVRPKDFQFRHHAIESIKRIDRAFNNLCDAGENEKRRYKTVYETTKAMLEKNIEVLDRKLLKTLVDLRADLAVSRYTNDELAKKLLVIQQTYTSMPAEQKGTVTEMYHQTIDPLVKKLMGCRFSDDVLRAWLLADVIDCETTMRDRVDPTTRERLPTKEQIYECPLAWHILNGGDPEKLIALLTEDEYHEGPFVINNNVSLNMRMAVMASTVRSPKSKVPPLSGEAAAAIVLKFTDRWDEVVFANC